jgi:anti-anti-sigma regulatory factor
LTERKEAEERIQQQAKEIMELSTPVMQVWQGVVVAPLIGSLDSQRTQQFMERLLNRIVETNSPLALVDIMGVPTIDTQTAQHLIETISAVRLLGAQVVLTGVRPAIAQTLVHLGIDLSDILTRSSLAAGLRVALDMLNLQVVAKNGKP